MNKTICVVSLSTCLSLSSAIAVAQTSSTPSAPATTTTTTTTTTTKNLKAKKAAVPIPAPTIPKGAVKTSEGAWRYKDPQGKTWIYTETPFGLSRVEETMRTASSAGSVQTPFGATKVASTNAQAVQATAAKPAPDPAAQITAVAKGDVITFQKPTPFGPTSWQKNKNDLTPQEQKVWDREQARDQTKETH